MKKILLCSILTMLCVVAHGQYFNTVAQVINHYATNLSSLDPIEGQYDVHLFWETPYFAGNDSWTYYIVREPVTNILTLYVYDQAGFHKSQNCRIEKISSGYSFHWHNCYGIIDQQNNGLLLKVNVNLDTQGSRVFTRNPHLVDKVSLHYTMTKVYPTHDDYVAAQRRKAESAMPAQNWTGTGFAISSSYIVTNYHVIENANSIILMGINGNFGTKHTATVAAIDKNNDLALLKLNGNVSITNIPYSVKTTTSDVGEEVFVLGYPLTATMGDEIKLTTGVISSKSGFQGDISQYQISAPVQPGNSGGPLFDSKGNVIGIVSAKHAGAENVGYAIKTSYLKSLVESMASVSTLPQTNRVATQSLSNKVKAVKNYIYCITCSK